MSLQSRFKRIRKDCTLRDGDGTVCRGRDKDFEKNKGWVKCKASNCPRLNSHIRKRNEERSK